MAVQALKRFLHSRRSLVFGYLISFAVFMAFSFFILGLRYGNSLQVILVVPFGLLKPSWWQNDWTVMTYNLLISLLPLGAITSALVLYDNRFIAAISHCALVLYWACVFLSIMP